MRCRQPHRSARAASNSHVRPHSEGNFRQCSPRTLGAALALNILGFLGRSYLILAFIDYRPSS